MGGFLTTYVHISALPVTHEVRNALRPSRNVVKARYAWLRLLTSILHKYILDVDPLNYQIPTNLHIFVHLVSNSPVFLFLQVRIYLLDAFIMYN